MFEKNLRLSYLLDFYGEVLDEHTRGIMRAYYNDDLSLAEIAEGEGISRQGVRHIVKKGEEQLSFLEERLGLASHYIDIECATETLSEVASYLESLGCDEAMKAKLSLDRVTEIITKRLT